MTRCWPPSPYWNEAFGGNHDVKDVPTKNKYEQRYYRLSNWGKFVRPVDRAPESPSSHRRSLLTAVSLFLNLPSLRSDAPHIGRHLYHTYMFIFSTLLIATLYSSSFSAMAALWRRFPLRSSTRPLTATSRICWRYDLCWLLQRLQQQEHCNPCSVAIMCKTIPSPVSVLRPPCWRNIAQKRDSKQLAIVAESFWWRLGTSVDKPWWWCWSMISNCFGNAYYEPAFRLTAHICFNHFWMW